MPTPSDIQQAQKKQAEAHVLRTKAEGKRQEAEFKQGGAKKKALFKAVQLEEQADRKMREAAILLGGEEAAFTGSTFTLEGNLEDLFGVLPVVNTSHYNTLPFQVELPDIEEPEEEAPPPSMFAGKLPILAGLAALAVGAFFYLEG